MGFNLGRLLGTSGNESINHRCILFDFTPSPREKKKKHRQKGKEVQIVTLYLSLRHKKSVCIIREESVSHLLSRFIFQHKLVQSPATRRGGCYLCNTLFKTPSYSDRGWGVTDRFSFTNKKVNVELLKCHH